MGHGNLGLVSDSFKLPDNACPKPLPIDFFWLTIDLVVCIDASHLKTIAPVQDGRLECPVTVIRGKTRRQFVSDLSESAAGRRCPPFVHLGRDSLEAVLPRR